MEMTAPTPPPRTSSKGSTTRCDKVYIHVKLAKSKESSTPRDVELNNWLPDIRSLAMFRVSIAVLAFIQSISLLQTPSAYLGDSNDLRFLHFNNSEIRGIGETLVLISAPLLALGLFTRCANVILFLGLLILQAILPEVLQGGDVLLRLLLFWALFLPLGRVWSIDARLFANRESTTWSATAALAACALMLQVAFVYWVAALLKSDPLWTESGNALFYALSIEHFTTPLGMYLRHFPNVLRPVSLAVPWFELLGPALLFVPIHRDICRMIAVILFTSFHLIGMQLLFRLGLFPWVCAAAWVAFLPGVCWDYMGLFHGSKATTQRTKTGPKVLQIRPLAINALLTYTGTAIVIISFLDVVGWNIASLYGNKALGWMHRYDFYGSTLRLDQRWNMYAPAPRKVHGWLVVPAELSDRSEVDLFTKQPVSWEKPSDIGAYFGDDRSRRYLSNLFDNQDPQELQKYADYLVEAWTLSHRAGPKVTAVTIIFMRQETRPDLTVSEAEKQVLYFQAY